MPVKSSGVRLTEDDKLDMRKRFRGLDPGHYKAKAAEEERVDVR